MFSMVPFFHNNLTSNDNDLSIFDWINQPRRIFSGMSTFKTDIQDKGTHYEVISELPGINKENISITYKNNYLTISTNVEEQVNSNKRYIHRERYIQSNSRTFFLDNVDENNISAKFENGILMITLPKIEKKEEILNEIKIN